MADRLVARSNAPGSPPGAHATVMWPSTMWRAMAVAAGVRRRQGTKAEAQTAVKNQPGILPSTAKVNPNKGHPPFPATGRHDSEVDPPDSEVDEAR